MPHNPLVLGEAQRKAIAALRDKAAADPVDMEAVMRLMASEDGRRQHLDRMTRDFTMPLPLAYVVTYTVEIGHPCGTCRHLSMSSLRMGKIPIIEAVRMVAEEFGFLIGDSKTLGESTVWLEDLSDGGKAVNVGAADRRGASWHRLSGLDAIPEIAARSRDRREMAVHRDQATPALAGRSRRTKRPA